MANFTQSSEPLYPIALATSGALPQKDAQPGLLKVDATTGALAADSTLRNSSGTEVATLAAPLRNQQVGTSDVNVTNSSLSATVTKNLGGVHNITQVTIPTTASGILVIATNTKRLRLRIINTGTNAFYVTTNSVPTTGNGIFVPGIAGYPLTIYTGLAYYAIATGGAALVSVDEEASL